MSTTVQLSDDSGTRALEIREIRRLGHGYEVVVATDDDVEGHVMSVAWAVDGFLKVSARDARALRVEVHDDAGGRVLRTLPDADDDVAGHALWRREWRMAAEPHVTAGGPAGHGLSPQQIATLAGGAAAAYLALIDSTER